MSLNKKEKLLGIESVQKNSPVKSIVYVWALLLGQYQDKGQVAR